MGINSDRYLLSRDRRLSPDREKRCPACECLNTELTSEKDGEFTSRCLNPKCVVGEFVETVAGMMVYDLPALKA